MICGETPQVNVSTVSLKICFGKESNENCKIIFFFFVSHHGPWSHTAWCNTVQIFLRDTTVTNTMISSIQNWNFTVYMSCCPLQWRKDPLFLFIHLEGSLSWSLKEKQATLPGINCNASCTVYHKVRALQELLWTTPALFKLLCASTTLLSTRVVWVHSEGFVAHISKLQDLRDTRTHRLDSNAYSAWHIW